MHFIGHDSQGARLAARRAQALALSQAETQRLETIVGGHMRIHLLAKSAPASRRAIYRFFRATTAAGVDLCLLSLADTLATYGLELPQATWVSELEVCRSLLEAWLERAPEMVYPPRLVSGDDLMTFFELQPGRRIGELLSAIQEGQAVGDITNREQALQFARAWLASKQLPQGEN
jgi:poly(A) polymerase